MPPPGETVWEQSKWLLSNGLLRNFLLNEPRGGVFKHINLLVPPKNPKADAAFIIMELSLILQCQVPIQFVLQLFYLMQD